MAAKKLQYTDIADKKLLDPLIKEAEQLNKLLMVMKGELQAIATANAELAKATPLDGYKNIEKVEKAINGTKKAVQDIDKVERERVKLQKRLNGLYDERAEANTKLKVEISERNRQLKAEAKLNSEQIGQYQKLGIRLGKLRKEYKETAIAQGRNSKAARELRTEIGGLAKELEQLDRDVKQQNREIGRYENGLKSLRGSITKLGVVSGIAKGFQLLGQEFNNNQKGADAIAKLMGRITVTFRILIERLINGADAIGAVFQNFGLSVKKFGLEIKLAFASLPDLIGGSKSKVDELEKSLEELDKQQNVLTNQGFPALADAFKGIGDEIGETIEKNDKLIDSTTKFRKVAIGLTKELGELVKEQGLLEQAADDNTTSLEDQREAGLNLLDLNQKIAEKNIEIAQNEVALARLRVATNKGSLEAREGLATAIIALSEAEAEAEVSRAEALTRIREIERDNIELDLDQLIDLADRRKTVNESIAKDEAVSFDQRRKAIDEAIKDIDNSFRAQAAKIQEGLEQGFNIDDLVNETDSVKLNERIKALGLDEIRQNRLREILQERIQATEDFRTAQNDLNKSEQDGRDIQDDIIAQEAILSAIRDGEIEANEALEALETRRNELAIKNLETKISQAEAGSVELLKLQQELNNLRLEQAQSAADEEVKIEKDKTKAIKKAAKEGFEAIGEFAEARSERRVEETEKEIEAAEKREDDLRQLAIQGNQTAQESLALEQQKRAELEQQRERQIQKQKQQELALSAIKLYASKVAAGEKNPLASTIADVSLLKAFIESLPAFYEGSELVGADLDPVLPGKDGHIIRVDGAERILSPSQNAMIPSTMSNMQLAHLAASSGDTLADAREFREITAKLEEVKRAIQSQETYKGMDFDKQQQAITFHIERKGRLTRKHKKISSVFG